MKKEAQQQAIDIAAVQSRMLTIRNQQVLLDRDVAALYGVETKALNQAVKRNAEKFPEGYILKMTDEECSRSQIVTLNGGRGSNLTPIRIYTATLRESIPRGRTEGADRPTGKPKSSCAWVVGNFHTIQNSDFRFV